MDSKGNKGKSEGGTNGTKKGQMSHSNWKGSSGKSDREQNKEEEQEKIILGRCKA